ncbi:XP_036369325.1uncharacterized protein LOC118767948 [Octopus vulgaris]|uniref:XP_036369325.1uncharacterized protein LOC118767948 n=1 Tax=Octopus vulgaris TaxID=6645 RepID=A0AA36FL63_OCTVU|nr:XP_036369325.1uncharacterized protein LOC118767948 [Octopus vulgaris]
MLKLFSIILLQWALTSQGFYFRTELDWEAEEKPQAAVTKECLRYSKDLDCRFYDCLNQRFPCGETQEKNKSRAHCLKTKQNSVPVAEVGKIWMNSIIRCFIDDLTKIYQRPSLDCKEANKIVLDIQRKCYTDNDFCNVGWDHRKEMWQLFNEPITTAKTHYYKILAIMVPIFGRVEYDILTDLLEIIL